MKVSIVAIGDELLLGQVTDTNSGAIARMLDPLGWSVAGVQVVHDDSEAIRTAIDRAFEAAPIVLTTGGLGPTKDDITKKLLADYFGGGMHEDASTLRQVEEIMSRNGRMMNALTRSQAMVPDACRVIPNDVGTAPLMWFERDGKVLVSMPGVPHEMLTGMERYVIPMLTKRFPTNKVLEHRVALVADLSESEVAMRLADWESSLPANLHLAYLPKARIIRLRLDGHGNDRESLTCQMDREFGRMIGALESHIVATEDVSLAEALVHAATRAGVKICTAESCTGGNIAHEITLVPGCSEVMAGGVVAYANDVKEEILGVRRDTILMHGAVSEPTVNEMLEGVLRTCGADLAIATSGIAGPGGGTSQKPVGTVVIGILRKGSQPRVRTWHFGGGRARVIEQATAIAITEALHQLLH